MISLHLHPDQVIKLARELRRSRRREIGGVLVGEHIGIEDFRLVDFSVQRSGGMQACFVRDPDEHRQFMDSFFSRTRDDFERFNYLGEWHSHPSFTAYPSTVDLSQMQSIVDDGPEAPLFAVLLVVRLSLPRELELGCWAFRSAHPPASVQILVTPRSEDDPKSPEVQRWWRRFFGKHPEIHVRVLRTHSLGDCYELEGKV